MPKKVLAVVVVALVALVIALLVRGGDRPEETPATGEVADATAVAEVARSRAEARARGEIDLSACSAAGRVVDARTGRGIEGAVVLLRAKGLGKPVAPGESEGPNTARTDAGGEWSIPLVAPGRYILTASAPGYLPGARENVSLQSGVANAGIELALAAGGHPLRGTVGDISGGAIEGAVVSIEREGEGNVISFSRTSFPAISDAEGRFEVMVEDGVYVVDAWHPDYTSDRETADVAGGPRSVELRLIPAATVEGTVRADVDGRPVEGAIVSLGGGGNFAGRQALSDGQGRFRLTGMNSGAHELRAVAAGYASREPVKVALGIGEALTGVEIRVDRAFKITGFVAAKGDVKRALSGVMVAAYSLNPMQLQIANGPSEVDGYFEIFGVRPGTYTLGSVAEEALPEILGGPSVTVEKADVTGVVVQLDRGVELRGRIEPPTAAAVSLTIADEEPGIMTILSNIGNMFVRSRADARGEFALRPVKPGKLRVVADAPDGSHGQVDVEVGERGAEGVVVVLEPRATVTGRVIDARGTPIRGGSVQLMARDRKRDGMPSFSINQRERGDVPIGDDGTYTARGLDGGEYEIRVLDRAGNVIRWAGAEDRPFEPVRRTIAAAVTTPGVDFTVEVRDAVIRGVVLDPEGAPAPDAWVTATPERGSEAESRFHRPEEEKPAEKAGAVPAAPKKEEADRLADVEAAFGLRGEPVLSGEDGRFEFTGLARRTYALRAEALKGSARVVVRGVEPGSEVRLQVAPLAEISGVVRSGGKAVPRFELQVREKQGRGWRNSQDAVERQDGSFRLDHLDPGTYELTAVADAGRVVHEVELKPGERAAVSLELEPWGKLRGTLLDARTGKPLAGVAVTSFDSGMLQAGQAFDMLLGRGPRTDATGRFEIGKIAPGKGKLQFMDGDLMEGSQVAEVAFEIGPGTEKDLGTIQGLAAAKVPRAERGELGLRTRLATETGRPRPPGEEAPPLEKEEDPNAPKRLWIEAVTIGGPGDKAGLLPGDEIVAIEGRAVTGLGADNAARLLETGNLRRGQSVSLEVARAGGRETVTVEAAAVEK